MAWTFERVEAELTWLSGQAMDKDAFCRAAGERIARVVAFDASCWQTNDPATLLITSHLTERLPAGRFGVIAHNEYVADDVNKFAELATSRRRAGTLRAATHDHPERSERYRELLAPNGIDGELRAALVDAGTCWGGLIAVRHAGRPEFSRQETDVLARLSRPLARGLRTSILSGATGRTTGPDAPGLIVLDEHGEVQLTSQTTNTWLQELDDGDELPAVVLATAAAARHAVPGQPAVRSRVRTAAGRWVVLHGSRVTPGRGHAAVIIEPATAPDIAGLLLGAYGLTARERELAELVLRGHSTVSISNDLCIAPSTVQDHLKAIFDKVGIRSRKELMARVFFEHFLPRITQHAAPAANGMLP